MIWYRDIWEIHANPHHSIGRASKNHIHSDPYSPVISYGLQDGAPVFESVNRWLKKVAEKTMAYGRYNELVHGDYFMVYKPTFTSLGAPYGLDGRLSLMIHPAKEATDY